MLKFVKSLMIGALALGLFLGSGSLINPASASAATIQVNHQPIVSSQTVTNPGQHSGNQAVNPKTNPNQNFPKFDTKKPVVSEHFTQTYVSSSSYSRVVTQAASILHVSRQVIINGLNNGRTLVQIGKRLGVTNRATLNELQYLQYSLNSRNVTVHQPVRYPVSVRPIYWN